MIAIRDGQFDNPLNVRREGHDTAEAMMADVPQALHSIPRPMVEIATALHFQVIPVHVADLEKFHGCSDESRIYIGCAHRPWEQRFTIGHELGHAFLWTEPKEWECNAYAEAVLLPPDDVIDTVSTLVQNPLNLKAWAVQEHESRLVSRLAQRYGVGYNALISALGNYGWIEDVPPWSARLHGNQVFEAYFQQFRSLCRETQP